MTTSTLGADTSANFRPFRESSFHEIFKKASRKFVPAKNPLFLVRESLCLRKIHYFWLAKVCACEKSIISGSRKLIPQRIWSLNKNELQCLKLSFPTVTNVHVFFGQEHPQLTKPFDVLTFLLFYINRRIVLCLLSEPDVLLRCVLIKKTCTTPWEILLWEIIGIEKRH